MFSNRHYGFNTTIKPLDDRRMHQAIIHAIDREAIVDEDFFGRHAFARGILPPGTRGYNPKLRGMPTIQPGPGSCSVSGIRRGPRAAPDRVLVECEAEGILREHEHIDRVSPPSGSGPSSTTSRTGRRSYGGSRKSGSPRSCTRGSRTSQVPDNFLFKLFHSQSSRNYVGYVNPVVDGLLLDARRTKEEDPCAEWTSIEGPRS